MTFSDEKAVYIQRDFFSDALFIRRLFRSYTYRDASSKADRDDLLSQLSAGKIDRLVLSNPYRDAASNDIYDRARGLSLPLLVIERGALPRSIFLDTSGFLRDSRLYDRRLWDRPLDAHERQSLAAYRQRLAGSGEALEKQSARSGPEAARQRLLEGKKLLCAVTLQMGGDTVTNHFCRPGFDYPRFKAILEQALPLDWGDWTFAVKPHPREPISWFGGRRTHAELNISDLIDAADAVVTFNSGTGVVAMMRGKPLGCFGDAFYGGEGLTTTLDGVEDLARFLAAPAQSYDSETRERFLHHLVFGVYSEVRFLGPMPFGPMLRPVAMQGRIIRLYDPDKTRLTEIDRRREGFASLVDREAERLRAWYRAASNKVDFAWQSNWFLLTLCGAVAAFVPSAVRNLLCHTLHA